MSELQEKIANQMFVNVFGLLSEDEGEWVQTIQTQVYEPLAQIAIDTICEALLIDEIVHVASLPLLNHLYGNDQKQYMQLGRSVIAAAIEQIKQV